MKIKILLIIFAFVLVSCADDDKSLQTFKYPIEETKEISEKKNLPKEVTPTNGLKNTIRLYKVYWSGLHVGDLVAELKVSGDLYNLRAIINSYGVARLISRYQIDSDMITRFDDGEYIQSTFKVWKKLRKKERDIKITYNSSDGKIVAEYNHPPEKRWKRKEVSKSLKDESFNPLTVVLVARQKIIEATKTGESTFTLPFYDGRRRGDLLFKVFGITPDNLLHISFEEKPVEGYTNNELKSFKGGKQIIQVYLSLDDFLPVKAKGYSPLGTASAKLVKECKTLKECL